MSVKRLLTIFYFILMIMNFHMKVVHFLTILLLFLWPHWFIMPTVFWFFLTAQYDVLDYHSIDKLSI